MRTFLFLICLISTPLIQAQDKRLALVIGNGAYTYSGELPNPVNDARSMKIALQKVGFEVFEYENLTQSQMKVAIDEFGRRLKLYSTGLFFYAGHGIQSKGYNYLIPVDANLSTEQQVEYDCVQADRVLGLMEAAGSKINIVILDACRNNPFERSWSRSTSGNGLAFMNAPSGSLIAYATSPGRTASDGAGSNGLYTSALLKNLSTPNITILQMFQNVRRMVTEESAKQQIPWESTSLTADFYFNSNSNTGSNSGNTNTNSNTSTNYNSSNTSNNTNNNSANNYNKENVYWEHTSDNKYWFYKNNEIISTRVISTWSESDLLVYDPDENSTYLLKNYEKAPVGQKLKVQTLGINENAFWRRNGESFWFYYKGEQIAKRTTSVYVSDDVLVYDNSTNTTFLLKDYKYRADNTLRPAILFDNSESYYWRKEGTSYWLIVNGKQVQNRTKSGWLENDLLVYDTETNTTFLFENYANSSDQQLKPAKVISYQDFVFWAKKEGNYFFYYKGEQVANRTTNYWVGNDLYVKDPVSGKTYILQDYANAPELTIRPALIYQSDTDY